MKHVTIQALVKRINRILILDQCKLVKNGDYFLLDLENDELDDENVDPEELGRELGLLRDNEKVWVPGSVAAKA